MIYKKSDSGDSVVLPVLVHQHLPCWLAHLVLLQIRSEVMRLLSWSRAARSSLGHPLKWMLVDSAAVVPLRLLPWVGLPAYGSLGCGLGTH